MAALHLEYVRQHYMEPTVSDKEIGSRITDNPQAYYDYDPVVGSHFPMFFHLSVLRTGILNWYRFRPGANILEIGAGFGALTGLLCQRCDHVTVAERSSYRAEMLLARWKQWENLDIYVGDWADMDFGQQFDYILLNGILERACRGIKESSKYADYLRKLANWLKPDGVLLFTSENRLGLKYFCGAGAPHTNRSFDGLNGYPGGAGGYSFSRQELVRIVTAAGFPSYKFYYPLPDYKLPQLVYTDGYLPEQNLKERLLPYYYPPKNLVAIETELYADVIDNNVFPFFANSFLVECGNTEAFCDVVYAAVSTDRGSAAGFATTVHQDPTGLRMVKKKQLSEAGRESAESQYCHLRELQQRGIPVLEMRWERDGAQGDYLVMPFIPYPTLSNYLKELIRTDTCRFQEILDQLYSLILQSSEQVPDHLNRLCKNEEMAVLSWGPILRKAYLELIPLNCFYNEELSQFIFFDQEFVRENYPARYVLFRAIHYIYAFTPSAESILPQQVLREKYDLQDTWDYYRQEETAFLDEIRNRRIYREFYRLSGMDRKKIWQNADKLMTEEEKIANYHISDKMKKVWKIELDILDEVDRICRKYQIQYFLVSGTLLGAVRHQGFIPWDDDLDIGMLRADYDKFLEAAPTELSDPLFLQTMWNEPDMVVHGCARVRNSQTCALIERELEHTGNQGIYIDILPFHDATQDERKRRKKALKIKHIHRLLHAKIYGRDYKKWEDLSAFSWYCFRVLARCYSHRKLCRKLDQAMCLHTDEETADLSTFTGYAQQRYINKEDFRSVIFLPFAGKEYPVPIGYQNYLFMTHGKDYMQYPPEDERRPKHTGIYDPENSYTAYRKMFAGMFRDTGNKRIALFGSGMMFEDYMKKWGRRYRPDFLVDNDEAKWGRKRMGIEIKPPEVLLEIPAQERKIIICSYYYKEISRQLEEMGIRDFQVYVQNMDWIIKTERR